MTPVLLLVPGMLNTPAVWDAVAPALADLAEVRIADVTRQERIADMARDAWAQLADLPAARPLFLCGFSMGGYVALEMLVQPQRALAGACLLCTSARPESAEGAALRDKTIAAIGRSFEKVVEGVLAFGTHAATQADAATMARLRTVLLGIGPEAAIRQNRAVQQRPDQRAALAAVTVPARVVLSPDDRIVPPEASEELAALLPHATVGRLSACGHLAPMEQPQQVVAQLRALLQA